MLSRRAPKVPVLVASFGGVGSKCLTKAVYAALPAATEQDMKTAHGHWRFPPMKMPSTQKLIYVYGDPRDAVVSFFRRRERRHERHSFAPTATMSSENPGWVVKHAANLEVGRHPILESWTLQDYASAGEDCLRLEEHFDFWMYASLDREILFVSYDAIWNCKDDIRHLLDLPSLSVPDREERAGHWHRLPEPVKARLQDIYGEFARRLAALPDVFLARRNRFTLRSGREVDLPFV